jgi:hypothetical protein
MAALRNRPARRRGIADSESSSQSSSDDDSIGEEPPAKRRVMVYLKFGVEMLFR